MKTVKVSAKVGKDGKPFEVDYKLGENLAELAKQFGEAVVYNNACSAIIVGLQGVIRGHLAKNKKSAEITEAVNKWKPGSRQPAKPPQEKLKEQFGKMSPEERKALLAELSKTK
jgi:hypothetical protein